MSRTGNSLRNAVGFLGSQMMTKLLQFICRTAFIYTLGMEYLGISSLYSNVITILNITELGIASAITYNLYDPLARKDWDEVCSLMDFYRKAYRVVGFVVLLLGLALMPFLPQLMTGVTDKVNIYHYYLFYLIQTVVSYWFFAYKNVLLVADQKQYLSDAVACASRIVMTLAQIASLFLWRSFLVYTLLGIASTVVNNVATAVLVDRRYPQLKQKANPISREKRGNLFSGVYALFLQRISTAVGTATDNLIISAFVNVAAVGMYSNYQLIVSTVQSILSGIFNRITASLGNFYVSNSRPQSYALFRTLNLANNYLVCLCSVCFISLLQPFITLWAGEDYLLDAFTVGIIVLNFATNYMQNVVLIFRSATGLFVVGKYRSVANAVMNLAVSLILVRHMGMAGVFLGSIISRLATNWWFDAWILCRKGFGVSPAGFYGSCVVSLAVAAVSAALVGWICRGLVDASLLNLMLRAAASAVIPTVLYALLYGRSPEAGDLLRRVRRFLKNKRGRAK